MIVTSCLLAFAESSNSLRASRKRRTQDDSDIDQFMDKASLEYQARENKKIEETSFVNRVRMTRVFEFDMSIPIMPIVMPNVNPIPPVIAPIIMPAPQSA